MTFIDRSIRRQVLELSAKLAELPLSYYCKIPINIPISASWSGSAPKSNHSLSVTFIPSLKNSIKICHPAERRTNADTKW